MSQHLFSCSDNIIKMIIIVLLLVVQLLWCIRMIVMKKKEKKKYDHYEFQLEAGMDLGDMYIPSTDDKVKLQIMDALRVRDQGENIIGLCGSVKRVEHFAKTAIRRAERDQLFQEIITTNVTKKPDITKIQAQIGEAIGLNFDDKGVVVKSTWWKFGNNKRISTAERAALLCAKMKELQPVLVVLHDVHGRLEFGEIGIPFGDDHNGCKILVTSTSVQVLSEQIKVHKLIQISNILHDSLPTSVRSRVR
ncbi:disease resistance protein RPS5-like [Trifolium pratense]|uniref:disease resistance protein RPS5-like n=1 Tax=Trifolium pratense TaxID=57577 RepID=UPI001E6948EF|nr:disease resistance protein RPS5-like [Trifolium pratense]